MHLEKKLFDLDNFVPDPTPEPKDVYRIGDLAREFGVTLRTLRFYEDRGLLHPERSRSTRLYSQKERSRLKVILLAKRVGFSLVEIQEIMEVYDNKKFDEAGFEVVLEKFQNQMEVLENQKMELENSIAELQETIDFLEDA